MSKRAESSGIQLSKDDAAVAKGMLNRGDRQHDIAAWFGVNPARIADIKSGKKHNEVKAKTKDLPPSGPYVSSKNVHNAVFALQEAQATISAALELISEVKKDVDAESAD